MRVLQRQTNSKSDMLSLRVRESNSPGLTYLFVDDDDRAHQWTVEDEAGNGAGDKVAHWTHDHVMLELVALASDNRPRLEGAFQEILPLDLIEVSLCMLAHIQGRSARCT